MPKNKISNSMITIEQCAKLTVVIILCHLTPLSLTAGNNRKVGSSISCYSCDSRNGTDHNCHDPFNPAMSKYTENCKVPKQNHIGVFPARFCVKVIGHTMKNDESLVIRACSLESMDNQCGNFKFEGNIYKGCILTCDYDGCNSVKGHHHLSSSPLILLGFILMTYLTSFH